MCVRMYALAIGRMAVPHRRRIVIARRSIIAHVGPQALGGVAYLPEYDSNVLFMPTR